MKLRDSGLYEIMSSSGSDFRVRLNPEHPIFAAHFPGSPIAPGAVLVEIVRELCSLVVGSEPSLEELRSVKFIRPVVPPAEGLLFRLRTDGPRLSAQILECESLCCTMELLFCI